MSPVDLSLLTYRRKKLTPDQLGFESQDFARKAFFAHLIDSWMILTASWLMKLTIEIGLSTFMVTAVQRKMWKLTENAAAFPVMTALIAATYFFFSFYLNHGQTYGMTKLKCRVGMPQFHVRQSFLWTCYALLQAMSVGLLTRALLKQFAAAGNIQAHDHLYLQLMVVKDEAVKLEVTEEVLAEVEEAVAA